MSGRIQYHINVKVVLDQMISGAIIQNPGRQNGKSKDTTASIPQSKDVGTLQYIELLSRNYNFT